MVHQRFHILILTLQGVDTEEPVFEGSLSKKSMNHQVTIRCHHKSTSIVDISN